MITITNPQLLFLVITFCAITLGLVRGYRARARRFETEAEAERLRADSEKNRRIGIAAQYENLARSRDVAWTKPAKRISPAEVRRAFAIDETSPLWVALNQEVDDYLQDLLDQVSLPPSANMSEEGRLHLAGGIEQLRLFHKRLLELHAAAKVVDEDIAGDESEKGKA